MELLKGFQRGHKWMHAPAYLEDSHGRCMQHRKVRDRCAKSMVTGVADGFQKWDGYTRVAVQGKPFERWETFYENLWYVRELISTQQEDLEGRHGGHCIRQGGEQIILRQATHRAGRKSENVPRLMPAPILGCCPWVNLWMLLGTWMPGVRSAGMLPMRLFMDAARYLEVERAQRRHALEALWADAYMVRCHHQLPQLRKLAAKRGEGLRPVIRALNSRELSKMPNQIRGQGIGVSSVL